MEIYIPTLGRRQSDTITSLSRAGLKFNIITSNYEDYRYWIGKGGYARLCPKIGIGPTRQWICDMSPGNKVLMMDDDLVFAKRREDDPTKFYPAESKDIFLMVMQINDALDVNAHVGVSTREGGNRDIEDFAHNTRLLRILAYRTDILRKEKIRFDRLELMEDFDVTLQLLRRGYGNVKLNWIVHNQRSSNASGGCSTYRTMEKQGIAAEGLQALHPDFVTVVEKQTKTAWQGQKRKDVIIQWKRAYGADSARTPHVLDSGEESGDAEEGAGAGQTLERQ